MAYKETNETMHELTKEYGEIVVRTAINYLIDVGAKNFTEENITYTKEQIQAEHNKMSQEGKTPFMTADFECNILDCANKLSQLDKTELLVYVQENLSYEVGQNTIDKQRLQVLLENSLSLLNEKAYNIEEFVDLLYECGFTDDEIEKIGYGNCLEKDIPDICE